MKTGPAATAAPQPPRAVRVGIADDHPIVRCALRWYLEEQEGLRVVGEASSGREAIDLVRAQPVDVLVLDVDMPGQSGMDALAAIKASAQVERLAVLVLSGYAEDLYAVHFIRHGASGYLPKSSEPEVIVQAIRCVAQGQRYLTPAVAQLLAEEVLAPAAAEGETQLSTRELQLLLKLARGSSVGQVAAELSLSPKTVGFYRSRMMRKLHARSDSDLTYYALKHRLVD